VKCEYLEGETCNGILTSDEGKEARQESCKNDNKYACCYLCPFYRDCEIGCEFLGEGIRECPTCSSDMYPAKVTLRVGGWTGLWKLVPFGGLGEFGEELLPVIIYTCSKCGKMEFFAEKKTKIEKLATG
jgi:hypothetical protein